MVRHFTLLVTTALTLGFASFANAGQKDFHDQDLTGKNFDSGSLNGADFSDAILKLVHFDKATLRHANFKGADISGVWFTGADLTEADLSDTKGASVNIHSHFDKANLHGMDLHCNDCSFKGADLRESKISGYIYNCDFSGADLRGVNMRGMSVTAGGSDSNRWKGALYDDDTTWPEGFDPKAVGAIFKGSDK